MTEVTMPCQCPSCGRDLKVVRLACAACSTTVEGDFDLPLLARLDAEEQTLALSFLKCSGSLKELARQYGVSYPTVRNRLDALIDRLNGLEARSKEEEENRSQ